MQYFHEEKNVLDYIKMAEDYDGKELIELLKKFLPEGSTILELGMGPGKDLDILSSDYIVTGSDFSNIFIQLYRKKNKNADLLLLDAITIKTKRKFDCVYSNKVLIHLTTQELMKSLKRQRNVLNPNGLVFTRSGKGIEQKKFMGYVLCIIRKVSYRAYSRMATRYLISNHIKKWKMMTQYT